MVEFVDDLEGLLPGAWIDDAVVTGRRELPPLEDVEYVAACDPSGGGADGFTFCIVHTEGEGSDRRVVQDVIKGWSRSGDESVDLQGVVREIGRTLKLYGLYSITGDKYSAGSVRQGFQAEEIDYEEAPEKSAAYREVEPLFAQGRIVLLDHPQMVRELKMLERRHRAGGRVVVDHPSGQHDDHANSLAIAAAAAMAENYDNLPVCEVW